MKDNNPLTIFKEYNDDGATKDYNLKCYMYFGGKNGDKIYYGKPILYDDENEVVAVAKLNRPIEKNNQSELTIRVRLDF